MTGRPSIFTQSLADDDLSTIVGRRAFDVRAAEAVIRDAMIKAGAIYDYDANAIAARAYLAGMYPAEPGDVIVKPNG